MMWLASHSHQVYLRINCRRVQAPCQARYNSVRRLERRLERTLRFAQGQALSGVLAVILSAAKDLFVRRARPFAALRVTGIISKCLPDHVIHSLVLALLASPAQS